MYMYVGINKLDMLLAAEYVRLLNPNPFNSFCQSTIQHVDFVYVL